MRNLENVGVLRQTPRRQDRLAGGLIAGIDRLLVGPCDGPISLLGRVVLHFLGSMVHLADLARRQRLEYQLNSGITDGDRFFDQAIPDLQVLEIPDDPDQCLGSRGIPGEEQRLSAIGNHRHRTTFDLIGKPRNPAEKLQHFLCVHMEQLDKGQIGHLSDQRTRPRMRRVDAESWRHHEEKQ